MGLRISDIALTRLLRFLLGASNVATAGSLAGLFLQALSGQWLASVIAGFDPHLDRSASIGPAVMIGVAVLGAWVPARAAGRVDPAAALRAE